MRPDIWTAATPVIIQEAALNGSADNRGDIYDEHAREDFMMVMTIRHHYYADQEDEDS